MFSHVCSASYDLRVHPLLWSCCCTPSRNDDQLLGVKSLQDEGVWVTLEQEHDQAVDPNLVRLGRAYDEAVAQLGGEAPAAPADDSSDGEEAAMGAAAAAGSCSSPRHPTHERNSIHLPCACCCR